MENLNNFLEKYNISKDQYKKTRLQWSDLMNIKEDYKKIKKDLDSIAKYVVDQLYNLKTIHSVRYRIKNPDHLIAKIIRKRIENPKRNINIKNYRLEITDLIGIRTLYLFKEDWINIHKFILQRWELNEKPVAYIRKGDFETEYKNNNCQIKIHPSAYRSVHYLIKSKPSKVDYIIEVQSRTIFEEGWSEIDHSLKYPDNLNDEILNQFLITFNRLAGSSDEMGSFVKYLKTELSKKAQAIIDAVKENKKKSKIIKDLNSKIKELSKTKPKEAKELKTYIDQLSTIENKEDYFKTINIDDDFLTKINKEYDLYKPIDINTHFNSFTKRYKK